MNEPVKIICPLCYSPDLHMHMEGLSNAASGTLTMPAGNLGNNNMELKCNACGHVFKPVDGKLSQESIAGNTYASAGSTPGRPYLVNTPDPEQVLHIVQTQGKLHAIKYVKDNTTWSLKQAKGYVDSLDGSLVPGAKKGCFIATACYGNYDAPEVKQLRQYRDQVLAASLPGRLFIRLYYFLSPPLARWLSRSEAMQAWVRRRFLAPLLQRLDDKGRLFK